MEGKRMKTNLMCILCALISGAVVLTACETMQQAATSPDYAKTRRGAGYGAAHRGRRWRGPSQSQATQRRKAGS
jgi:hypothetical protein